jgi:hypothetical protein
LIKSINEATAFNFYCSHLIRVVMPSVQQGLRLQRVQQELAQQGLM